MKGYKLFTVSIPAILAGVGLALAYNKVTPAGLVTVTAALLIVTGVLGIALMNRPSSKGSETKALRIVSRITAVAAEVLGIVMLIRSDTFVALVPWGLGLLLAIAAIAELVVVIESQRGGRRLDRWWAASSLAIAIAAGYVLTRTTDGLQDATMMLVTGIALGVFGVVTTIEALLTHEKKMTTTAAGEQHAEGASAEKKPAEKPRPLDEGDDHVPAKVGGTGLKTLDSEPKSASDGPER